MISLFKRFILMSVFVPFSTYATVYKLDYSGNVNVLYASGLGFHLGEHLSGSLLIDTSLVVDTQLNHPTFSSYQSPQGKDFVKGYFPASANRNADYLLTENGFGTVNTSGYDVFAVADINTNDQTHESWYFELYAFPNFEWLPDKNIKEFDFDAAELQATGRSFGSIAYRKVFYNSDGTGWATNDQALFSLDSLKLKAIQVVEPVSPLLLLFSVGFLILRRKFKV